MAGYTGPLIHLELEKDACPRFFKARPVPLALQGPMEYEFDSLQHQGIFSPIQHSNWALVRKNNGTLRVFGVYRNTVNAEAAYPLLTTAEAFENLYSGTFFLTLDLYQAY